ncbi:MAG: 4-oxalomesaconate tautomerase [Providencia alcalifaciens]|jgi:2-methylaconitate cis-trans-isomerase PrpF|nr:4-oxalomesaconate tautomerase [Providencia alcalifaciens]
MKYSVKAILMRGGVARGIFFNESDLPQSTEERNSFFLSAFSSPLDCQNDGIGGGSLTSNRIAIIKKSNNNADIDFTFAQVLPNENKVDYSSNCGNMLAAAGPYAIEAKIIVPKINNDKIKLKIYNKNTGSSVNSTFCIENGTVKYAGDTLLDGIQRKYSPIELDFGNAIGLATGKVFPTGSKIDTICGIDTTCIDAAMPIIIIRSIDLGLTGLESKQEIDDNIDLKSKLLKIRLQAGILMGFDNVKDMAIPKICIFTHPSDGGTVAARYIDPIFCHPQFGITAGLALATAAKIPGTNINEYLKPDNNIEKFIIEHPSGTLPLTLNIKIDNDAIFLNKAANITTAKKIFNGILYAE